MDYSNKDRDKIKTFLLRDKMNLPKFQSAEIITFNTIALRGAIKDIGRALEMDLDEVQTICNAVVEITENGTKIQKIPDEYREKYPELFKFADIVNGTIVSVGTHPSGVLICDRNIEEEIGLCSIASTPYPVSCLNMKELDGQNWVKLDILG